MYQIFVVEDELLIRQNIRNLVESMQGPYVFCGEASDGEMALSMMQDLMPDILLTDIRMPFLDGFELIRHVKAMMPWIKIIIISGYDDFEYARKAISLGVDHYLLKPVRAQELTSVIEKTAKSIDEAKAKSTLGLGYDQDEINFALRQRFMEQLLYNGQDTGALLEKARNLNLDVVSANYQIAMMYFDAGDIDMRPIRTSLENLLARMKFPLYHFSDSHSVAVVFTGSDEASLTEQTYRFIAIVRHELKELSPIITTVISDVVSRFSAISDVYRKTYDLIKKVTSVSAGQIITAGEASALIAEILEIGTPFGEAFQERLTYAETADVPGLVNEVLESPQGNRFNSMLMRYNTLIDLLKMTAEIVKKASSDPDSNAIAAEMIEKHNVIEGATSKESFRETVIALLETAVSIRNEKMGYPKYNSIIRGAEKYVQEHFCDPNISLMSVARHVGMSAAHFSTVFSQTTGRSFINYLTAMRIEKAKKLLSSTNMKLSAIAMEIGYNEPNYFSHVFRKVEGITPKEFRSRFQ
ncbi:MAG: response regulator [Clostridia bacterium]|nr:response regulator [Clostridia bacterium]